MQAIKQKKKMQFIDQKIQTFIQKGASHLRKQSKSDQKPLLLAKKFKASTKKLQFIALKKWDSSFTKNASHQPKKHAIHRAKNANLHPKECKPSAKTKDFWQKPLVFSQKIQVIDKKNASHQPKKCNTSK